MESKISMQEENPELDEMVEEDDDSDGPPPGFQCVITRASYHAEKDEVDEEDDEGPPPGFHSTAPKPSPAFHSSDEDSKQEDDDVGPPPGWEFFSMANALPKLSSNSADANLESNDELNEGESEGDSDDEGPPPGWEKVSHHRMPPSCTPPLQPSQAVSSDSEMGSKQETSKNNDEMPQSESQLTPLPLLGQSMPPTPQLQLLPPSASPAAGSKGDARDVDKRPTSVPAASPKQSVPAESGSEGDTNDVDKRPTSAPMASPKQFVPAESGSKEDTKDVDKRPKSVPAASPKQFVPSTSHPSTPNVGSSSSEKVQLVCGTCRKLLLYPRGAKWVQCPGCQEVNFVLEAHEVGQVKCGNCAILLMYPHGAPAVQCTSCSFVTEIGAKNMRPPLSVQMAQRRRRPIRGRTR
ncbi:uncharacterized protein [Primulina eburnea]|uniref:uncharacterized protein isoform X2 n=1 Tax=Primulina eburnea TaxID=1245227 RepID=UPI003C6CBDBB